jgi:hypothetical protein
MLSAETKMRGRPTAPGVQISRSRSSRCQPATSAGTAAAPSAERIEPTRTAVDVDTHPVDRITPVRVPGHRVRGDARVRLVGAGLDQRVAPGRRAVEQPRVVGEVEEPGVKLRTVAREARVGHVHGAPLGEGDRDPDPGAVDEDARGALAAHVHQVLGACGPDAAGAAHRRGALEHAEETREEARAATDQ